MKTKKDIGFVKQLVLRFLTFLQEVTLKQDNNDLYYSLTKLHFKLYFGKSLVDEAVLTSDEFRIAQKRHVSMVMVNIYSAKKGKGSLAKCISNSFYKNLILEAKL